MLFVLLSINEIQYINAWGGLFLPGYVKLNKIAVSD